MKASNMYDDDDDVYRAYAQLVGGDRRPILAAVGEAFDAALEPVIKRLQDDGLSRGEAVSRAAGLVPGFYPARRACLNGRAVGLEDRRTTLARLLGVRATIKRLVARADVRKRAGGSNEAMLRRVAVELAEEG